MIRFGTLAFNEEEKKAIEDLINAKEPQLSMGKKVAEFEKKFADWLGVKHAVMVNSGTSALIVALEAYNNLYSHGPLLTTSLTYPADWNALRVTNTPYEIADVCSDLVFHEDDQTECLAVHLLGKPCRVNAIIEDTAEAMGSTLKGKKLGSFGLMSTFSFYVAHQINTIEGGMVATNNDKLYEVCRSIRDNGRTCTCPICTLKSSGACSKRQKETLSCERRWETSISRGYNFKPLDIQGALGVVKMKTIDENCKRRNEIFLRYSEAFKGFKQEEDEFIVSIAYPLKVKRPLEAVAKLEKDGIECRGMFPAYSRIFRNAYKIERSHILLPLHQEMTDKDVDFVIEKAKLCQ